MLRWKKTRKFKPNAQILAKRAAAEGPREVELAELSDTQAVLNPVGSQSKLSYRIATLQHKVFEDLKAGIYAGLKRSTSMAAR